MQKHPSSLEVLAEIFVGIGGNFSKDTCRFSRIAVEIKADLTNTSQKAQ
jgi:hypothetical protein